MTTGVRSAYVLFDPSRRIANKSIALSIAAKFFNGHIVDKASIETPDWGLCHVAAYTDLKGAMIATTESDVQYGEAPWHSKGRIVMVREHPKMTKSPARITIYVCEIEDLFKNKSVGHSGVKWEDVSKVSLFKKTLPSSELKHA